MLDLEPIKTRLDKASYEKRPLKLHVGCKNPYACKVCMDYNAARLLWEADLMHLQSNAPTDIAALIAEVERVRAENEKYKQALTEIHDMTYHNKWRGEVRTPFSLSHASNCARYVLDAE